MEPTAEKKVKRFDVTLAGKHMHGGKECQPGEVITVREDQVKRLEGKKLVASKAPAKEKGNA